GDLAASAVAATPSAVVLEHQETLDQRIAEALGALAKGGRASEPAERPEPDEPFWLGEEGSGG
ncbi:MAG TPA: hypothetical protein VG518_05640, partial [Solirubrobacterales bacterium]|nr:hypothetical protein [Solirubrobacterales bacterium]